jgi:hypothetical protein
MVKLSLLHLATSPPAMIISLRNVLTELFFPRSMSYSSDMMTNRREKNMRLREIDPKPSRLDREPPPLLVRPSRAVPMLSCGRQRLYALLNSNEIESFSDGRARFISVSSLLRYIDKQLGAAIRPNEEKRFRPQRPATGRKRRAMPAAAESKPKLPSEDTQPIA